MSRRESKELVDNVVSQTRDDAASRSSSDVESEEEERKAIARMEEINSEFASMSKEEQKRVRNLECEAARYLWYPDPDSMKLIRCRCCPQCQLRGIKSALDHLKSKAHKRQARHYVIANCKDKEKIKERRKANYERMQKWLEKKKLQRKQKKKEKLKNLTPEEIAIRKEKFQQKKARRLERKKAASAQ